MDGYALVKLLHVLSATLLFGTGLGSAFHMWLAHRGGDVRAIAVTARYVILADWLFTVPSGIVQPATGIALILLGGFDPFSPWLVLVYLLSLVALACWLPVMTLQYRVARLAGGAAASAVLLPPEYHRAMRQWFWLGWPAFLALVAVFALMTGKPSP